MVVVIGSVVKEANSSEELMTLFEEGSSSRHVASTKMNAESSRSHLVLSIVIESTNLTSGAVTKGKVCFGVNVFVWNVPTGTNPLVRNVTLTKDCLFPPSKNVLCHVLPNDRPKADDSYLHCILVTYFMQNDFVLVEFGRFGWIRKSCQNRSNS